MSNQLAIPFDKAVTKEIEFTTDGNLYRCEFLGFSCWIEGKLDSFGKTTIYELCARKGLKGYGKVFNPSLNALQSEFAAIVSNELTEALGIQIKVILKH
jgi:hypothetical protein